MRPGRFTICPMIRIDLLFSPSAHEHVPCHDELMSRLFRSRNVHASELSRQAFGYFSHAGRVMQAMTDASADPRLKE